MAPSEQAPSPESAGETVAAGGSKLAVFGAQFGINLQDFGPFRAPREAALDGSLVLVSPASAAVAASRWLLSACVA